MKKINSQSEVNKPYAAVKTKITISSLADQELSNPFSFELNLNRLTINFKNPLLEREPLLGPLHDSQGKSGFSHDDSFEYTVNLSNATFDIQTETNIHLVNDGKSLKLINKENKKEQVLGQISNLVLPQQANNPDSRKIASRISAC